MEKIIDFNKTVYELVKEYPEIKMIMVELGFKDIVKPFALEVMGRHMTIIKGSKVKEIPLSKITEAFKKAGFTVLNGGECKCHSCEESSSKEALLRSYIERLNNGEDLETIRKEFVENFEHVSVHDIINVEQDIINSGTDVNDVQKLCDLHSALFHGMTEEEIYRNEEERKFDQGFPINILKFENKELGKLLEELKTSLDKDDLKKTKELLIKLKEIKRLYQKKEELLMPLLYERGVTGPSDVMWGVDDEIKAEYSSLSSLNEEAYQSLKERIYKVSERTKEMIYKEENILFPLALEKITLDEWVNIYFDIDETGFVFVSSYPKWEYAEERRQKPSEKEFKDGYITLDGGKMKVSELNALFKLLPIDITFIDSDDINKFFINNEKVFSRPKMALNRKVYLCHPPRIVEMIKGLLQSFKEGKENKMVFWTPNPTNPIKVTYLAVRDENDSYLGAVELVQTYKDDLDKLKEITQTH